MLPSSIKSNIITTANNKNWEEKINQCLEILIFAVKSVEKCYVSMSTTHPTVSSAVLYAGKKLYRGGGAGIWCPPPPTEIGLTEIPNLDEFLRLDFWGGARGGAKINFSMLTSLMCEVSNVEFSVFWSSFLNGGEWQCTSF